MDGNFDNNDGNFDGNDGNFDGNNNNADGNIDMALSHNEKLVMQIIKHFPSMSAAKIGIKIGISKSSVERILRSLKQKNISAEKALHVANGLF